MKKELPKLVERGRETIGIYATTEQDGNNGRFKFRDQWGTRFLVLASDGFGWDHVSVSLPEHKRCPTWDEMCWIKDLFWDKDECVIQYHPREDEYINGHPYCLHLWKPIGIDFPRPHPDMVGSFRMVDRDGLKIRE